MKCITCVPTNATCTKTTQPISPVQGNSFVHIGPRIEEQLNLVVLNMQVT